MLDLVISLIIYYLHISTDKDDDFYCSLLLAITVSVLIANGFHTRFIDCFYPNATDSFYIKTLLNSYLLFTPIVLIDYLSFRGSKKTLLFFK
jgi:hypothetical protein